MARRIRPDWQGALHHLMARGIDGKSIFGTYNDCVDIEKRFALLIPEMNLSVYAWVIMPNHFHLLLRTGSEPLSKFMQRLLTGYAVAYNKRNDRIGHVFQGRFKSILVQEDNYFDKLIRYIHMNPVKAGLVPSLKELDEFKWSGHSVLIGKSTLDWYSADYVLDYYENNMEGHALENYRSALLEESGLIRSRELVTGSYRIGSTGLERIADTDDIIHWSGNCRVLGDREYALSVLRMMKNERENGIRDRGAIHSEIEEMIKTISRIWGFSGNAIRGSARNPNLADARAIIAYIISTEFGLSHSDIAKLIRMSRTGITSAVKRGKELINNSQIIRDKLNL